MTMKGKGRKKGDWLTVMNGRKNRVRELLNGRGLSNIPNTQDTGSAAYRRLTKGKN